MRGWSGVCGESPRRTLPLIICHVPLEVSVLTRRILTFFFRELLDFKKVWLEPGESKTVVFEIFARDATLVDDAAERVAVVGGWTLRVESLEAVVCT